MDSPRDFRLHPRRSYRLYLWLPVENEPGKLQMVGTEKARGSQVEIRRAQLESAGYRVDVLNR